MFSELSRGFRFETDPLFSYLGISDVFAGLWDAFERIKWNFMDLNGFNCDFVKEFQKVFTNIIKTEMVETQKLNHFICSPNQMATILLRSPMFY